MAGPIRKLEADFWLEDDGIVCGFAVDADDLAARLVVEILADGLPVAVVRAQDAVGSPTGLAAGAGRYGFSVRIDDEILATAHRLVARLANENVLVGSVEIGDLARARDARRGPIGAVRWAGGLRIVGHLAGEDESDSVPLVKALIEGTEVARAGCRSWIQLDHGRIGRAFELYLPDMFADGRVRPVEIRTDAGVELPGSPCLAVAFPDKLADWIDGWTEIESETIHARFIDGLWPQSLPFEDVEAWLARFPAPRSEPAIPSRVAVILVGEPGLEATLASLEAQIGVDWSAAALRSRTDRIGFVPAQLRTFLNEEAADCDLVVMAVSGTVFAPSALALLVETAGRFPDTTAFYPDVLVEGADGRRWPQAFPAFDPELFLETAYCGLVYAIRRRAALASPDRCASLFGLFPVDENDPAAATPVHCPALLATVPELADDDILAPLLDATRSRFAAEGVDAEVEHRRGSRSRTVRVSRAPAPGDVAVVIATRDNGPELDRTLASLDRTRGHEPLRVVIADNGSTDPATVATLEAARRRGHDILSVPGWFCVPHLLNRGAERTVGADHLLFLEAGVMALDAGWLDDLLGRSAVPAVGVVGPLVAWASGIVRDAGYVLGSRLSAVPRFIDRTVDDVGHGSRLDAAHRCSAVSAACLLTPRRLFADLEGFDVRAFPMHLHAADYCQRVREARRHVVFDPHVRLRFEGRTTLDGAASTLAPVSTREARVFRQRWSVAPGCDPFYSPWMTMDETPFSALAWPPTGFEPRRPAAPAARPIPAGL